MFKISDGLMNISCIVRHNPDMWTQGTYFRDEKGNRCSKSKAFSFCSMGFTNAQFHYRSMKKADVYLSRAIEKMSGGWCHVPFWNDHHRTKAKHVWKVFEEAAKLAESEGN